MSYISTIRNLKPEERNVILASYLGWTLDAFDFFVLVFLLKDIASELNTTIKSVTLAITLTLAMRPIGALIFGYLADRMGRRPALIINILIYSALEGASGFAPSLTALIVLRALYGVAMGGEWGVGASLTLESVPSNIRGFVSGILQAGYPSGYFLASAAYFLLYPHIGWRGMFVLGMLPAFLILYIRRHVKESPSFLLQQKSKEKKEWSLLFKKYGWLAVWGILMMAGFNFLSHGTQDIYPTFLQQQHHLESKTVGTIALIYNIGAILGGITFGVLSDRYGRRIAIIIAALMVLPIIPIWTLATTPLILTIGAFLIQFFAQGAWGVVPVHLNEISPKLLRGTFPGVVYQVGNLIAAGNATFQAGIAASHHDNYALALAIVAGIACVTVAIVTGLGPEAKGIEFVAASE